MAESADAPANILSNDPPVLPPVAPAPSNGEAKLTEPTPVVPEIVPVAPTSASNLATSLPDYALKYAPFVYLHSGEKYWPANVRTHVASSIFENVSDPNAPTTVDVSTIGDKPSIAQFLTNSSINQDSVFLNHTVRRLSPCIGFLITKGIHSRTLEKSNTSRHCSQIMVNRIRMVAPRRLHGSSRWISRPLSVKPRSMFSISVCILAFLPNDLGLTARLVFWVIIYCRLVPRHTNAEGVFRPTTWAILSLG
jgi:hypothetical protein